MTPVEIKQARQSLGLSTAQLGAMLDTDAQTIRRMEQRADAKTFRSPAPRMLRLLRGQTDGGRIMSIPIWLDPDDERQRTLDAFYWKAGPCCAGCDWWVSINSLIGECRRSAPVSAKERYGVLQMTGCSIPMEAGHILTARDHHCGDFKDDFDWSSLSPVYLRHIGAKPKGRQR